MTDTASISVEELEETLGALEGKHGEGWINITMKERRLFARLLRDRIASLASPDPVPALAEPSAEAFAARIDELEQERGEFRKRVTEPPVPATDGKGSTSE